MSSFEMPFSSFYSTITRASDYAIASYTYLLFTYHQKDISEEAISTLTEDVLSALFDILTPIDEAFNQENDDYPTSVWIVDHWFSYLSDLDATPCGVSEDKAHDLYTELCTAEIGNCL